MTKVVIVEQSYLIRLALRNLIQSLDNTFEINDYDSLDLGELKKISSSDSLVLLANPEITNNNRFDSLKSKKLIIINLHHFNSFNGYDENSVYLNDSREIIIGKIEKALSKIIRNRSIVNNKILSKREADILKFVALGLTNKEIADKLFISTHTVITHRKNISAKLGIKTIAGFTVYALLNKILLPEEVVNDSI